MVEKDKIVYLEDRIGEFFEIYSNSFDNCKTTVDSADADQRSFIINLMN